MTLADKVKNRRIELGLTQDELAKRMGYKSRVSVNKIENGRDVSQKIIVKLAKALNVKPSYLIGWDNENFSKDASVEDGIMIFSRVDGDGKFKAKDVIAKIQFDKYYEGDYFGIIKDNRILIVSNDSIDNFDPNKEVVISFLNCNKFSIVKIIETENNYTFVNEDSSIKNFTKTEFEEAGGIIHGYVVNINV